MSALIVNAITPEVALSAATAKTVVQIIAPANHRLRILEVGVFFTGVSVTAEPVVIQLMRQTTAGTATSLTLVKDDDSLGETILSSASHTATAEPTSSDVIDMWVIHPQQGINVLYPLGQEKIVGGGDRVGLVITAPAAVDCRAKIRFEE